MQTTLLLALLTTAAHAQSTISATDRYAYSANVGWIDFLPSATDGTRVLDTCLAGYGYAANFGWIHLGNGTPSNGHIYTNTSATDFGVNLSPTGSLTSGNLTALTSVPRRFFRAAAVPLPTAP